MYIPGIFIVPSFYKGTFERSGDWWRLESLGLNPVGFGIRCLGAQRVRARIVSQISTGFIVCLKIIEH